jgi:hypothetical protein
VPDVRTEIDAQLRRLRLYRDLRRLNGRHLFALAHLYGLGKTTAIARCVELGEPVFVKQQALTLLARRRPELAIPSATILRLRPFYDLVQGRSPARLPFEPVDAEVEILKAVEAVECLGRA